MTHTTDQLIEQLSNQRQDDFRRLQAGSEFAAELLASMPESSARAIEQGELDRRPGLRDWMAPARSCRQLANVDAAMAELRRFRNQSLAGIIWRDLLGLCQTRDTLTDLSRLATALIRIAWQVSRAQMRQRFGRLLDADGQAVDLVVLGMGKLGGGELNLSSDIDLIFAYRGNADSDGKRSLSAEEYCRRQAQLLIRLLGENTADGFCYRVDTRLRPHGQSGRLALSFDAMEGYYQREGRDWERYALIKAYPSAGPRADGHRLLRRLRPFVFRRYIDFTTFESIRAMKREIRSEHGDGSLDSHIKLGPGGIREVEFIAQGLQLVRGGRDPQLRQRALLPSLQACADSGLLPAQECQQLTESYLLLRDVENRLQAWQDRQTHQLPSADDTKGWQRLAQTMNQSPQQLKQCLETHRQRVHSIFRELFDDQSGDGADTDPWQRLWQGDTGSQSEGAKAWAEALQQFRQQAGFRQASRRDRERLEAFMPVALERMHRLQLPQTVLSRLLQLVSVTLRRSAYLALLLEHPAALDRLLTVLSLSQRMSDWLAEHPILLDELLDERVLSGGDPVMPQLPPARQVDEIEQVLIRLAEYRQAVRLRLATRVLLKRADATEVSARLSELADTIVEDVLERAEAQLAERHGHPSEGGVAVIGYGRVGSGELGFDSDLDLVCIHPDLSGESLTSGFRPVDASIVYRRSVQRLLSWLHGQGPAGRLFEVDMRLRPNGNSGLLVSSLRAYRRYQFESAWTWELQALVRARFVAGNAEVGEAFETLRQQVLCQARDAGSLRPAIDQMRQRLQQENRGKTRGRDRIKFMPGGMLELEFLVQALVLEHAAQHPQLSGPRATPQILRLAEDRGVLPGSMARALQQAWATYHATMQWRELGGSESEEPDLSEHIDSVQAARRQLLAVAGG